MSSTSDSINYPGLFPGYDSFDEKNFPPLPIRSNTQSALHSRVSSFQSLPGSKERSSTPKVPPGFETTHAHPESTAVKQSEPSQPSIPKSLALTAPVLPAIPVGLAMPRSSTPKPKVEHSGDSAIPKDTSEVAEVGPGPTAKKKPSEISLGSPKPKGSRAVAQPSDKTTSLEKTKDEIMDGEEESTKPSQPIPKEERRIQKPSKIEIPPGIASAAETSSTNLSGNEKPDTPITSSIVATPPLMTPAPATPATATSEMSRASVSRPRTLRVTTGAASKTTIEPALPSATTEHSASTLPPTIGHSHPKSEVVSRQLSISSVAKVDSQSQSRPSTPAMSDRLISEGVSRASSPPPSIVGSAPERTKTKTQSKKERREKARSLNKSIDAGNDIVVGASSTSSAPPAEEVGPIVARQKKQKKKVDSKPPPTENEELEKLKPTKDTEDNTPDTEVRSSEPEKPIDETSTPSPNDKDDSPIEETQSQAPTPPTNLPSHPNRPYLLREFLHQANIVRPASTTEHDAVFELLDLKLAPMNDIFSDLLASGDLSSDHVWFNPPSFNSAGYKLPPDGRKGQEYLDAHGYVGNHAFGYVYLPGRERRALERGNAVGIANSGPSPAAAAENNNGNSSGGGGGGESGKKSDAEKGEKQEDLLKRCLITPSGVVYRHLNPRESEKVLELEERRQFYLEEFGEDVGGMHALSQPLEADDFINLAGGMEELGRHGERHGVVWVGGSGVAGASGDDARVDGEGDDLLDDEDEELAEEDEDEHAGLMSDDDTDDLGIDLGSVNPDPTATLNLNLNTSGAARMPHPPPLGSWDTSVSTVTQPTQHHSQTQQQQQRSSSSSNPLRTHQQSQPHHHHPHQSQQSSHPNPSIPANPTINLRALDLESLQKRVTEKQKESENAKRDVERMEKMLAKKGRELGRWREGLGVGMGVGVGGR